MPRSGNPGQRLLRALSEAGYSNTRTRRAVVAVLAGAAEGLSASDILVRARRSHPRLGLVTVYRTLEILSSLGLVRRIHLADGCHSYALSQCSHGHHVICERCHQTIEFEGCGLEELEQHVRRQTGFAVTDHWLELFGLCPRCQAETAGGAAGVDDGAAARSER